MENGWDGRLSTERRHVLAVTRTFERNDLASFKRNTHTSKQTVKSFRDKISKPSIVLEVGSGSGSVITGVSRIFGANDCLYLAIDKNPKAAKCSKLMLKNEGVLKSDIIVTSLSSGMRLKGCVDVLLFNPPYVVTPDEEMEGDGISISWAGGKDGRIVIDQFLKFVPDLLSPKGVLFLVLIEENKPQEVIQILKNMYGLSGSVVAKERCGIEILYILLVRRAPS